MYLKDQIERIVLFNIVKSNFRLADNITRAFAYRIYKEVIAKLPDNRIFELVDTITGGLGYKGKELDPIRMPYCGSIIAWPEGIASGKSS